MAVTHTWNGRASRWSLHCFLAFIVAYIMVPMIAVALYSLATRWTANLLPDDYTLKHWANGFADSRFRDVLWRSLWLAMLVALASTVLIVPAAYWQRVHNPAIRSVLQLLAAIPLAIPILVIAYGLLRATGDYVPMLQGTTVLLFLSHVGIAFPFVYWTIDSAMAAARVEALSEAAKTCGASFSVIVMKVILPNIGPGVAAGALLAFGTSFNEVALVQVITGSRFETVQLYMLNMLKSSDADYNVLAVMTIINFVVTLVLSVGVVWLNGGLIATKQGNNGR